jgi:glycosyltransferase involved in cell wall biosynthesis
MTRPVQDNLSVSVIVPARNEEASLSDCLESLVAQGGVSFEILVVDDASTDRTRQIAAAFPTVEVIDAGPLPDGWTGKNNAMWQGAKRATGKWLLFTDADTVHYRGSLQGALSEAEQQGAALLSYSPQQEIRGFWEKAVMPVIFAELARAYPPAAVNDAASPVAAANGQYILILRAVYQELHGHAAIRSDLLEDVGLARLVKFSGRKISFRYGGDRVRTRMYRNFRQLREGWTKNLALLFPHARALAFGRLLEFAGILASGGSLLFGWGKAYKAAGSGRLPHWSLRGAAVVGLCYLLSRRLLLARKAHFSALSAALSLLGLPVFAYLLLRSRGRYEQGQLAWKDRTYTYSRGAARIVSTQDASRALRS